MSELTDRLEQLLSAPKRAKTAAGEVESHSLAEQIAALRHIAASRSGVNPFEALRFGSFVPPNALGEHSRDQNRSAR